MFSFLATLTSADILLGLALTASILILISDWRLSLLALSVQYLLVTVLLSTIVQLEVALVRFVAGGLVAVIFALTAARAVAQKKSELAPSAQEPFIVGLPFRLIALVLVGVSVVTTSTQFLFPNAPLSFWLVSLWLCAIGLLLIAITRDTLKIGIGVLSFSAGFGVLYLAIEPNLLFYGLLLIADLLFALAIAHLVGVPMPEPRVAPLDGES